jgi:hypothetical protein
MIRRSAYRGDGTEVPILIPEDSTDEAELQRMWEAGELGIDDGAGSIVTKNSLRRVEGVPSETERPT